MPDQDKATGVPGSALQPVSIRRREGFVYAVKVNPEDYMVADDKPGSPTPEERAIQALAFCTGNECDHEEGGRLIAAAIRAAVAEEREAIRLLMHQILTDAWDSDTYEDWLDDIDKAIRARV